MHFRKLTGSAVLALSLLSAAVTVSACRHHPGHDSDRHHHDGDHH
jgi:hypothetical protein